MIEGVVSLRNGYITKALNGSINDCWAKTASGFLSKNMYPNDYRINVLFNAFQKLTDTYEYNFELCCKAIANAKWTARPLVFCHKIINLHPSINFSMFFIFVSTLSLLYSRNKGIAFAGVGLIVFLHLFILQMTVIKPNVNTIQCIAYGYNVDVYLYSHMCMWMYSLRSCGSWKRIYGYFYCFRFHHASDRYPLYIL